MRVAVVLAAALVASTLSTSVVAGQRPPGVVAARGSLVTEAPDAASAVAVARAQGSRVEVVDQRSETRAVFAEPQGTMTAELSVLPVRVKQGGTWVGVDTALIRRPDGSVGPRAAAVELSFSGGGTSAPMVVYGRAGQRITLSWPGSLPAPALAGNTATYTEVLPGVDLVLRAEVDGYAQYLVVKNSGAAKNPAVAKVRLGLRTDGVRLRATETGALEARDSAGAVVFAAPVSQMWDSSPQPRRAVVTVAVDGGALTLRPDPALLTDRATVFPVTVDPVFHTVGPQAWTSVLSGNPNAPYWNSSGHPPLAQVGYCDPAWDDPDCNGLGRAISYFLFDTSFLTGKRILSGHLQLTVSHSPNCAYTENEVYKAYEVIHPGTTWNNRPGGGFITRFAAPNVSARFGCGGDKEVGVDVTNTVNPGWTTTYIVQAVHEFNALEWRKYHSGAARLRVLFNTVPNVPTGLTTDPPVAAPCRWCSGNRYVGDEGIRLKARLSDPDGDQVKPLWHLYVDGRLQPDVWGGLKGSGEIHDLFVDLTNRNNQVIDWHVIAHDGAHGSDWPPGAGPYIVDRTPPAAKPNVTGLLYRDDGRWHGGVGVPGTFTFDSAGVNDIDHFRYGFADPPTTTVNADALGGTATVPIAPTVDGPRSLFVQSVDRAGHRSPTQVFRFYVRAGNGPLAQWSFEGNATDEAFLGDRHGTVHGNATFGAGAVGSAVRLDGMPGTDVTAPSTVRTDTSFSVSAWVKPDQLPPRVMGAVSQDGNNASGFYLNYRGDLNKWTFMLVSGDIDNPNGMFATAPNVPQSGRWTQLTGVYDRPAGEIRLYVDGALAARTALPATFIPWHATGSLVVGRERWNRQEVDPWIGSVDEVKVYDRVLSDAEVRAAVGQDNVQVGHWRFDEREGTTARNAVEGGDMAVLHNGASFTGGASGAVRLDGADDYVATSGPVVRTDQSFSVAAWVEVDRAPSASGTFTAAAQDGTAFSGFFLGYRQWETGGVWEFYTPSADAAVRPGDEAVRSTVPAQVRTPTHLAAVYDAPARQIRLYVNGALAGTAGRTRGFDATGPLLVGRGRWDGNPANHWPGLVDELRAYSRVLSEPEIRGIVSRDNVALGVWKLDGNATDTSGRAGPHHGTVGGSADWTGGQSAVPDPTDLAIRLNGTGAYVSASQVVNTGQSFSVTAWAKLDRVGGGSVAVVSQAASRHSTFQLQALPDGRWAFAMARRNSGADGADDRAIGTAVQVGAWAHLVGVYDAAAGQLALYVNGVLAGTGAHPMFEGAPPAGGLQIGRAHLNGAPTGYFPGAIDDVAVYGRVLFAEEIRAIAGRDLTLAHKWTLDEGSGTNAADAIGSRVATLAGGAVRVPGRLGNAVRLDGVNDTVSTAGVDIRTDAAFTVSVWVHLGGHTCDPGTAFSCKLVAVSLDGSRTSKFRLGYVVDRDQNRDGVWTFEMAESDAADATITKAAVSTVESDRVSWVHLVGVYDKAASTIWLYVNGTRIGDGVLDNAWHATGGLQIGRGKGPTGAAGQYFPGTVDDVRLYSGGLDDGRIGNLFRSYPEAGGPATLPPADAGQWRLDETTGTAAADSSGRGLTATTRGGAGWGVGRTGGGASLNGTTGYAETAGPVLDTSRSFSVAAWIHLTAADAAGGNRVVIGQDGDQVSAFLLLYNAGSRRWEAAVPTVDSAATTTLAVSSTEPAAVGDWTHLTLAYDANLDQLRLYVNGLLSAAQVGVTTWNGGGRLSIGRGRWNGANSGFFPGAVDDVRAFGTALSHGEVRTVYNDVPPVLHGLWRFDDDSVRDSSWRTNHATASGSVSYAAGVSGRALVLDGSSGSATTVYAGVSTRGSLTVSAWAKLTHKNGVSTVVGQDGTRTSGFVLQYRPNLDRWVFAAPSQDADAAELAYAYAAQPAVPNQWVHLTGVYDHAARQLRLYVNGQLAGSRNGVTLWLAGGGFTIGRGMLRSQPAEFFAGAIDEVRTDLGVVPDGEIASRAGTPAP